MRDVRRAHRRVGFGRAGSRAALAPVYARPARFGACAQRPRAAARTDPRDDAVPGAPWYRVRLPRALLSRDRALLGGTAVAKPCGRPHVALRESHHVSAAAAPLLELRGVSKRFSSHLDLAGRI